MSESTPPPSGHCPECGIAVATGYMRCPKCHTAMPDRPSHPGDAGAARVQGGTTVQSGGHGWLYAVGGVAVIAALIVFVVSRGGDDEAARGPAANPKIALPEPGGAGPTMRREISGPSTTRNVNPAPDPVEVDQKVAAARLLLSRLESARMWSTVQVEGAGLGIKSGYCEDPVVRETIDAITGELSAAGVKIVTCYERHGPKVFDLVLTEAGAAP